MRDRVALTIGSIILLLILIFTDFGNSSSVIVYDCGTAEWHPDIPASVKEECRKIRFEELEKQQQKELQNRIIQT
jgi:hypothetical protein